MKVEYISKRFRRDSIQTIEAANQIIEEYKKEGFILTLRQLYYQFVSRDLIHNTERSYKRLGNIINQGRLAGLIDWTAIEDRGRALVSLGHWSTPADIINSAAHTYHVDLWEGQPERVEVWVEKEALSGIVEKACEPLDVPFFACKGYNSQSEMWGAAQRLNVHMENGASVTIIHLGDHDPSGIDMTRDIKDRLNMFCGHHGDTPDVHRIALNMDQVSEFNPPPNFAKVTDARFDSYSAKFGNESWELDALDAKTMVRIISGAIEEHLDTELFNRRKAEKEVGKELLVNVSRRWNDVVGFLK
jgi:hypothetical protein